MPFKPSFVPFKPSFDQYAFRIRNDDGSETTATWVANINVSATIAVDTNFRVRIGFTEVLDFRWTNVIWNLYYSLNGSGYAAVSSTTPIKFSLSSNFADGDDCTQQLSVGNFNTDNNGMKESTGGVTNSGSRTTNLVETEWCLQLDSTQISANDTIDLRIYNGSSAITSYTNTPRITASVGGGPQSYTLTCEAGSYSLTGTNADLTVTRHYTLTCEAGSYALTGTNAALTSSRTLVCEPASGGAYPDIIVSGAGTSAANGTYRFLMDYFGKPVYTKGNDYNIWWDSGLNHRWEIYLATGDVYYYSTENVATPDLVTTWTVGTGGSLPVPTVTTAPSLGYVLTGSDVTLTYTQGAQNLTLTCEAGSYSLTGSNVDFVLQRNYTFACDAGSYSLTGTDTTFEVKRNYTLECSTGSYSLTGSDVTLAVQRNYTLVCEPGSYTLTGTDITFGNTTSYTLVCASGSYALTGSNVTLTEQHNFTLALESGSYLLTGTDADLVLLRNYILACEAGSYALTGTNTALTSARTMALESGSYALTGTNAGLFRGLVLPCASGSYALTGSDATFNANYVFALGMGSYVLVGTNAGLFILSPTPACRTATIEFENRTFTIPHENRTLEVKCH